MDNRFRFELGVFADGFVPTAANTSEWTAHWVAAQRVVYNASEKIFAGQLTVTSNATPFTLNAKAYIWGFAGDIASNQWILFRKSTWNWPEPNPLDPFGLAWYAPESNEVILGSIHGSGSPYLMKAASVTDSYSPVTTWAQWLQEELSGQPLNGTADDPDHDGVSNLFEYLFGTPPQVPGTVSHASLLLSQLAGESHLQFVIPRRGDHPASLLVEVSSDLVNWESGPLVTDILQATPSMLVVRDRTSLGAEHPRRFMRLRATLP